MATWKVKGSATQRNSNRWRPDRDPHSCTYAQLEQPLTFNLADIVPGLVLGDA
jgi:hypothetical protein